MATNQFVARNGIISLSDEQITGSLFVSGTIVQITGSLNVLGGITGSLLGTAISASYAVSSSFSQTASYAVVFPYSGSAQITGSLSVSGSVNITGSLALNQATAPATNSPILTVTGNVSASSALAQGTIFTPTLTAAANNDVLVGLDIAPTFTTGSFTGVTNYAARIRGTTNTNFFSSGNVGINQSTDAGYKLDVNGIARISGVLTLSSTITNGTYTYTLPGATGTLALTSQLNSGTVTSVAALTLGTTGTDLSSTVANGTTTPVITLNVPTASATNRGALSSADWTTFNNKQSALSGTGIVKSVSGTISYLTDNSGNWNTAYGWGNWASNFGSSAGTIAQGNDSRINNGQTAYSWGNPSGVYLPLAGGTLTGALSGISASFSGNFSLPSYSTTTSTAQIGSMQFIPYVFNNTAITDNIVYNSGYKYVANGYGTDIHLNDGSGNIVFLHAANGTAGSAATMIYSLTLLNSGAATFASTLAVQGTTASSSYTTGALVVSGGVGIAGALNGTSASFTTAGGTPLTLTSSNTTATYLAMINTSTGGVEWDIASVGTSGNFTINQSGVGTPLTIAKSTGAATFSSDIYSGRKIYIAAYPGYGSGNADFYYNQTSGNVVFNQGINTQTNLSANGTLSVTGAATFASLGTGTVYSNGGTLTNTNPSDRRLKQNITPITYGLNEVLQLNPVSFDWKNDNNKNKQFGFIAQEVQEVMPEAVIQGEYLGLEKDAIYTALVNAIKEQQAQIEELKSLINK